MTPTRGVDTVVVTGASRGIGLAITDRLLAENYRVAAVSRTQGEGLTALAGRHAGRLVHVSADLADTSAVPDVAKALAAEVGGEIYGLVNNAGVGLDGLLATQHAADIERLIAVNLTSTILLSKHLVRLMIRRRRGRIVNISSIVARTGFSGLAVYGATKAGLEGFTRSLAREVGRVGITVNAVAPGFAPTEMTSALSSDQLDSVTRRSPLGLIEPIDVAGAVRYLLSDDATRVTGSVITVDGGSTA